MLIHAEMLHVMLGVLADRGCIPPDWTPVATRCLEAWESYVAELPAGDLAAARSVAIGAVETLLDVQDLGE